MTILYLTNNPQLAGTSRILLTWLDRGRERGYRGLVVVPAEGQLSETLRERGVAVLVNPMPWIDRRSPAKGLRHLWRVYRWARAHGATLVHCNEHDVYPFGRGVAWLLRAAVVCHVRFQVSRDFCSWAFGGRRLPDALLWTSN